LFFLLRRLFLALFCGSSGFLCFSILVNMQDSPYDISVSNRDLAPSHVKRFKRSAIGGVSRKEPPAFFSTMDETGSIFVTHREYLGEVYAPGVAGSNTIVAFQNTSFSLNPGLQSTFPWLSQIAQNYTSYEFYQTVFSFESSISPYSSTQSGQCGTVIMSTNYNSAAQPFSDKLSMIDYAHSETCKITDSMQHGIECDPSKIALSARLYIRANPVMTGQDVKTYDHGLFQIAVANCPAQYNGSSIGELYVSYKVRLFSPRLFVTRGLEIDQDQFITCAVNDLVATWDNPFGTDYGEMSTDGTFSILSPDSSRFWLTGQQNNIGIQRCITNNASTNTSTLNLVFPANYCGSIEILLSMSSLVAGQIPTFPPNNFSYTVSGNVVFVNDVYIGGAAYNTVPYSVVFATMANPVFMAKIHVYVKPSTGGKNNGVTFSYFNSGQDYNLQTFLQLRQYQSFNNSVGNPIIQWLDNNNQLAGF